MTQLIPPDDEEQPQPEASTSSPPPVPPTRSYAAAAGPKPKSKPLPSVQLIPTSSLLDPVQPKSFFSTAGNAPASTSRPLPPVPQLLPKKHAPTSTYVDVSDHDSNEDSKNTRAGVRAPLPIPGPKRGTATSAFRPSMVSAMQRSSSADKGKATWAEPLPPPGQRNNAGREEEPSPTRTKVSGGVQHQTSSTRSTVFESRTESKFSDDEMDQDDSRGRLIEWGDSSPKFSDGKTVPALLMYEGEDGAAAGMWHHPVYDYELIDPLDFNSDKYEPLGTFIPKKKRREKVKGRDRSASASVGPPGSDLTVEAEGTPPPPDATMQDAQSPSTSADGTFEEGYLTPTMAEIISIRPHPDAFFCPQTFCWVVLTPDLHAYQPNVPPSELELWREEKNDLSPVMDTINMLPPPLPARQDVVYATFNPHPITIDFEENVKETLRVMRGTSGRTLVWTDQTTYPTVLTHDLIETIQRRHQLREDESIGNVIFSCFSVIWRAVDNVLFKGEHRGLPTDGKIFSKHWPAQDLINDVFVNILGYVASPNQANPEGKGVLLNIPLIDARSLVGQENRRRLLRCWLELGLWMDIHKLNNPEFVPTWKGHSRLRVFPAKPALERLLHYRPIDLLDATSATSEWTKVGEAKSGERVTGAIEYEVLGVVPTMKDEDIIKVYDKQVELTTSRTTWYFSALEAIAQIRRSDTLTFHVVTERSKGRVTLKDLANAWDTLGCANTRTEDAVASGFQTRMDGTTDVAAKKGYRDALNIIANDLDSEWLKVLLSTSIDVARPKMTLDRAFVVLELDKSIDSEALLPVYEIRCGDNPSQKDVYREALETIAEERNVASVKQFLKGGSSGGGGGDRWEAEPAPPINLPIGLTNIANTCYLNSLLQYFFTIRELREAILKFSQAESTDLRNANFRRVGGREVTRKEVERSRRFVVLLQGLFNQLIHASTSAVTPETELAYLALVPSKEEPDIAEASKDESDDVIIVEEPTEGASVESPASGKSPSVLGKRGSDHLDNNADNIEDFEAMAIDSQSAGRSPLGDRDVNREEGTTTRPRSKSSPSGSSVEGSRKRGGTVTRSTENELVAKEAADGVIEIGEPADIEMSAPPLAASAPPPLPPRRPVDTKKDLERQVSSYMQFGRQNDVTECMDNVMFQIECALNPVTEAAGENEGDPMSSLLQSTFYGKMKQVLEIDDPTDKEPVRVKEEPFFSLLVDVAEEGRDVYDGLDTVFDDAIVEIEGKKARRTISLVDVPPILQIQLQRVQYDREAKKIFKSNAHMAFANSISIDRYLEVNANDAEAVGRKTRTNECRQDLETSRARLRELKKAKTTDMGAVLKDTFEHLSGLSDIHDLLSEDLAAATIAEAGDLEQEVLALTSHITELRNEVATLWSSQEAAVFDLVSVFIHRGTASSGHYFIYQRDSSNKARWLKYNDSIVSEADPANDIFKETTGDSNAYFLVYCRRDRLDAIDSMCRQAH